MSERDKWEKIINDWATLQISSEQLADIIISTRNATVQKVVGPLTKYAGLSSHGGRVYADIDESLKLADEVCK